MRGDGTAEGVIEFVQYGGGDTTVNGHVTGLKTSAGARGLHILEHRGSCPPPNELEHFNPFRLTHGARTANVRHAGDLGNVNVGFDGVSNFRFVDAKVALTGGDHSIINRTIVITEHEDDLGLVDNDASRRNGYAYVCSFIHNLLTYCVLLLLFH